MSGELLYILVEGEPASPELPFLQNSISKIFKDNDISYVPEVFEIGGSSVLFNSSLAKTFYKHSKAHTKIPVLAIADSDYRVRQDKLSIENSELINARKAKVLYWDRHEWENYLLEETQLIADFVNQFPKQSKKSNGFSKKSDIAVTKDDLDNYLTNYFAGTIKEEFFECLKFNLNPKINYPSISKPSTFDTDTIEKIESWFLTYFESTTISTQPKRDTLYEEIKSDFNWHNLINQPDTLPLDFAKNYFRGKEALTSLIDFICREFKCNFNKSEFQIELLKQINNESCIIKDLKALLLKELQ